MSHHETLLEKADSVMEGCFEIKDVPLSEYIRRLKEKEPFKFSRYGDGEWAAILNPNPEKGNCDGVPYSYELSADLAKGIVEPSPHIEYGMQPLAVTNMGEAIKAYLGPTEIKWTNADVLHTASEKRELASFADALRERKPIVIGARQWNNASWLDLKAFLQVPSKDVYRAKGEILELLSNMPLEGEVVLLACSMLSEVIIYEMASSPATMIDIGSVFDPWLGIWNRGYHHELGDLDQKVYGAESESDK